MDETKVCVLSCKEEKRKLRHLSIFSFTIKNIITYSIEKLGFVLYKKLALKKTES